VIKVLGAGDSGVARKGVGAGACLGCGRTVGGLCGRGSSGSGGKDRVIVRDAKAEQEDR
jgi:hypothetical protein